MPDVSTHYPLDPSALTTDAIEREVNVVTRDLIAMRIDLQRDLDNRSDNRQREQKHQEDLFEAKLAGIQEIFDNKILAINDATLLRLESVAKVPNEIKSEIGHHEDLQLERFKSIALQFNERDIRTEQAGKASTEALAAALQAAKELVTAQGEASAASAIKSETSFTKQIDQIGTIISTLEKALDARITELKERIDRTEGNTQGSERVANDAQDKANAILLAAVNAGNAKKGQQSNQIALVGVALIVLTIIMPLINDMLGKL